MKLTAETLSRRNNNLLSNSLLSLSSFYISIFFLLEKANLSFFLKGSLLNKFEMIFGKEVNGPAA
jgi:hypothetical protein